MGAEESRMKHEESEEIGEVRRAMDGSKMTGTVENGMEPRINLKVKPSIKLKRSI